MLLFLGKSFHVLPGPQFSCFKETRPGKVLHLCRLLISVSSLLLLWEFSYKRSALVGCGTWRWEKKKTHIIFPWLNHRLENILAVCTCTCQVKCQNNLHTNNSQDDQIQMQSYKAVKKSSKQFTEQKFEAQVETVTSCFSFDSLCALMQREDAFLRALTRIQKVRTQPAGRTRHGRCSPRKHGLFRHGLDQ